MIGQTSEVLQRLDRMEARESLGWVISNEVPWLIATLRTALKDTETQRDKLASLADRVRPGSEAAPWVIEGLKAIVAAMSPTTGAKE